MITGIVVPGQSVTLFVIPPASTLQLTAGPPRMDGKFALSVGGQIGQNFIVQSSPDLTHWSAVSTNTLASTNTTYLLPVEASTQFYRAALSQ